MHAATAVKLITLDAHQLHGGMGYVVETDLHLFSERARLAVDARRRSRHRRGWLEDEMNWEPTTMTADSLIDAGSAREVGTVAASPPAR